MIPKRVVKKIYPQKMLIILGKFFSPLSPIYCMILALTCIYNSDLIKLVHRFSSKVSISLTATRDVTFDYFSNSELRRVRDLQLALLCFSAKKSAPKNVIHLASSSFFNHDAVRKSRQKNLVHLEINLYCFVYVPTFYTLTLI